VLSVKFSILLLFSSVGGTDISVGNGTGGIKSKKELVFPRKIAI